MKEDHWLNPVFGEEFHRPSKPRSTGVTMVIDRGLGQNAFDEFLETNGEYIDQIKFAYGTAAFYDRHLLNRKLQVCHERDILVYPGGTLFEVAHQADSTNEYFNTLLETGFKAVEISDGSIQLSPEIRGELIARASERGLIVMSEVGKKDPDRQPDPEDMARQVRRDFKSGAEYVTIESRESGKGIGIYDQQGEIVESRLNRLVDPIDRTEKLLWEAPL
ncbi:MAG: phosphosulfolactate synthase, partial [bacterium]